MLPDNIVVGEPLVPLESLGVLSEEKTVRFTFKELHNDNGEVFFPTLLKDLGFFKSTSEIRKINDQRMKNPKFTKDPNLNLWRNLTSPEMTMFKIGKRVFWLIVGE